MAAFVLASQPFRAELPGCERRITVLGLEAGAEEISLPASKEVGRPVIYVWTRTAVHGQSLQTYTIPSTLSQLHCLLEILVVLLKAITVGHLKPTGYPSEQSDAQDLGPTRRRCRRGHARQSRQSETHASRDAEAISTSGPA